MRISHFFDAEDKIPKQLEITWKDFVSGLGPHRYRPGGRDEAEDQRLKEALPCFSPAEYPDGGDVNVPQDAYPIWAKRLKKNVVRVHQLVLDVDKVTEQTYLELVAFVQQLGLAAVVYSTWGHAASISKTGLYKFRVAIPLDKPVEGGNWKNFWLRATALFGNVCDTRCKDASRIYFGPFAPIGTEAHNFYYAIGGGALAVDSVLATPLPEDVSDTELLEGEERRSKDSEAITLLATAWPSERRHEAHLALAGGLLSSGFSDERAVEFLCAVARQHSGSDEEREKRESAVQHTREQLDANENITGWTTLSSIVGYDVVQRVRALVERPPDITDEQLRRYAKDLKRSRYDEKRELGDALERVCKCTVFPESLALKLATQLGERFLDYDSSSIAKFFEPSLRLTIAHDVTVESVEARIKQKQVEEKQRRADQKKKSEQREREVEHDRASRIRESFNNGRSHPYTLEELRKFAPVVATGHQWILQKDRAYYFFHYGKHRGPYTEAEAHNAALRELAPAMSAGVELYKVTKESTDFKSLRQLVAEYGTVADELLVDLRAQATTYDPMTRTIIEAPCPLRPVAPVYHADIDEWLYHLAGPDYWYDLKTWLAILPRLDIVRVALFLTGKKSLGKSLLALGCSRLWTTRGPTSLEAAFGTFNDIVASCPLCFADEHLPKDFRGYTMNPQLRHHIQATERMFKRKFLPNGKLIGVTPTIVAAHDPSILRTPEELSNNEIEGIMERYFHIAVRDAAGDFLANLRPTTFERGWVDGDKIAEFVMWLYYNHQHESQGRFYINRPDVENTRWLATSSGARSSVLRWLCSYLADRTKLDGDANTLMLVRVHQGQLLVNIRGLLNYWDKYIGNEKCPPSGKLAQTVAELSYPGRRVQLLDGKRVPTNYRVIHPDNLYAWAKNSDLITEEEITKQLARASAETNVGLTKTV